MSVKLRMLVIGMLLVIAASAQKSKDVYVDKNGVMRWGSTKEEVHGFGINYTAPFAHAYRTAKKLNIPLEKAIDDDVYHFARLGFDAYRVHVWDCEISDTVGNLLSNDHLRMFDYMLMKMKARGMKFIITPIAFWGNGWPERDEKTPGFSSKYGKGDCLTNEDAIKAQETYLFQFLNHVNTYTKIAYKDDPDIIAFEVSNEPHHGEAPEKVTKYITRMVQSMRNTGCKKPIFYNISHSIHLVDAYFNAQIQGGTFQWYPTGLGFGRELGGNFLPNVDLYRIPFAGNTKFKAGAKIVYEFDAADIGRSYIYPAMARSFRTAGMQVATHFAYDPTYMANVNTEYGTHYMNLAFAPQKALSLMISSEVFHKVPLYKSYGSYPGNASFDGFRVDYEDDLAEYISDTKFLYTNNTRSTLPSLTNLKQIAGFGTSVVVSYDGAGAYFLDKVSAGVWRLEVMPDAIWIDDPFKRTSPKKEVAKINWRKWNMSVTLPDLGEGFEIKGVNEGNQTTITSDKNSFEISPGTYLLVKQGTPANVKATDKVNNLVVGEFAAPKTSLDKTYVLHHPIQEASANQPYLVQAVVASNVEPDAVELHIRGQAYRSEVIAMKKMPAYRYEASIPADIMKEGFFRYFIVVKNKNGSTTFPSDLPTHPYDWDFYDTKPYEVKVVPPASPIFLFNAETDAELLMRQWSRNSSTVPTSEPGKAEALINIERLFVADPENRNGEKVSDYSFKYFFGSKVHGRLNDIVKTSSLLVRARALNDKPCQLQVALVMKDGSSFGKVIQLDVAKKDYSISLSALQKVKEVTLPRPYPTFLSYYFENNPVDKLDMGQVESVQFSIGPGIPQAELSDKHGVAIESVRLE